MKIYPIILFILILNLLTSCQRFNISQRAPASISDFEKKKDQIAEIIKTLSSGEKKFIELTPSSQELFI